MRKISGGLFFSLLLLSCPSLSNEGEPAGGLILKGAAVNNVGTLSGRASRAGLPAILFLSQQAAVYHTQRDRGYEWSIRGWNTPEELSSLDAGQERFQLQAEENPPMARKLVVGAKVPSGNFRADLAIYSSKSKIGDSGYLLSTYRIVFSLDNE